MSMNQWKVQTACDCSAWAFLDQTPTIDTTLGAWQPYKRAVLPWDSAVAASRTNNPSAQLCGWPPIASSGPRKAESRGSPTASGLDL